MLVHDIIFQPPDGPGFKPPLVHIYLFAVAFQDLGQVRGDRAPHRIAIWKGRHKGATFQGRS